MQTEILYQPAYALCRVMLSAGESMRAESGAMVSMSGGVQIETKATGGIMKSLGRSLLGGESFFQ
ncbi:MAG TPA: AIM24 family protein, partial [Gemmatimonadales bacterium]|nr:AIM24 family protein [Gemmatimonadales bacterium]